jgi:predicted ATPase with chaperone activity
LDKFKARLRALSGLFDMQVSVAPLEGQEHSKRSTPRQSSEAVQRRVVAARAMRERRQGATPGSESKVLRVARTIAYLEGSDVVGEGHVAEATRLVPA